MSYLRREKPDSNLKKADICGDFWDFCNFTVKRCHICDAPCASHNVTSAMRPVLRIKNHPILTNWVVIN